VTFGPSHEAIGEPDPQPVVQQSCNSDVGNRVFECRVVPPHVGPELGKPDSAQVGKGLPLA
jgi:hypothetical protein